MARGYRYRRGNRNPAAGINPKRKRMSPKQVSGTSFLLVIRVIHFEQRLNLILQIRIRHPIQTCLRFIARPFLVGDHDSFAFRHVLEYIQYSDGHASVLAHAGQPCILGKRSVFSSIFSASLQCAGHGPLQFFHMLRQCRQNEIHAQSITLDEAIRAGHAGQVGHRIRVLLEQRLLFFR